MTATQFPGETARPAPPRPARKWPRRLGLAAVGVLALLGPWPVDNGSFQGTAYEARTLDRLAASPGPTPPGPIRVGVAEVDLTPDRPVPLAGFSNQAGKPFGSVDSRCFGRALTVAAGPRATTIVTADLLLVDAELARLVAERAGVEPEDLYFTASHTHGGPGAWGRHPLERIVAGKFDPAIQRMLADRLGDAVRRSRSAPVPAEVALVQAFPAGRQKNRVVPGAPTHDALSALIFRPAGAADGTPPLAILAVFGAHATIVRADPPRLSADYPGALAAALEARTGAGMVLFAAGAVGDAAPVRPEVPSPARAAKVLGEMLADDLLAALPSARFAAEAAVDRLRLAVDLPPVRLAFGSAWLRFSPAATWWIADQTTHLDALCVGPAVLLGFPGDEAGHLAARVVADAARPGLTPVITSFNGDYRGYFESAAIYRDRSCYETRWMNFYGPQAGEYLGDVAARVVGHLDGAGPSPRHPGADHDTFPRAFAAILLAAWGIAAAVSPGKSHPVARSTLAWAAVALTVGLTLAFILAPGRMDWSRFARPREPIRLAPLIFGLFVAYRIGWRDRPARLASPMMMLMLTSLTAIWPIVLAMAISLLALNTADPAPAAHQSK